MTDFDAAPWEEAVREVVHRVTGEVVGRFYLIVEVINPTTGAAEMNTVGPDDQPIWDTLGMLRLADLIESSKVGKD